MTSDYSEASFTFMCKLRHEFRDCWTYFVGIPSDNISVAPAIFDDTFIALGVPRAYDQISKFTQSLSASPVSDLHHLRVASKPCTVDARYPFLVLESKSRTRCCPHDTRSPIKCQDLVM